VLYNVTKNLTKRPVETGRRLASNQPTLGVGPKLERTTVYLSRAETGIQVR
jgi:hypothetical protein